MKKVEILDITTNEEMTIPEKIKQIFKSVNGIVYVREYYGIYFRYYGSVDDYSIYGSVSSKNINEDLNKIIDNLCRIKICA